MIFYAQSRGVARETAVRLIVEGFFANVYDRITLEPVQETLRQAVAAKLEIHGEAEVLRPTRSVGLNDPR
jgi:Fe-S cluster assembly protein SufD